MNISISKVDLIWSYLGYILKFGSGIFILPIILKTFSIEEMGIWYIFIAIGSFVQLMETGFTPNIMRNISYAFGGATVLEKNGINKEQQILKNPNYRLLSNLIYVSKKIYFCVSIVAMAILLLVGSIYIWRISVGLNQEYVLIAWIVYSISIFLNLYYGYWVAVLMGIGRIGDSQKSAIVSKLVYLFISMFILCYSSYGLIIVSVANLVSGVVLRICCKHYFTKYIQYSKRVITDKDELKSLFKIIWYNSKKMLMVSIGGCFITQSIAIISSIFLDLKTTATYGLTLQIFGVISALSTVYLNISLPLLNEFRVKRDTLEIKRMLFRIVSISWSLFLLGSTIFITWGKDILNIIGSKTDLLQTDMMVFMMIYLLLEINHGLIFGNFILSNNNVPFIPAALGSGLAVIICSIIFLRFTSFGLWGLLISQAIVQLFYNNWKWPMLVIKQLDIKINDIMLIVIKK